MSTSDSASESGSSNSGSDVPDEDPDQADLQQTVHYQKDHIGHSVLVWQSQDGKMLGTNKYVKDGVVVSNLESKVIDGILYTRIGDNEWIQTQYLVNQDRYEDAAQKVTGSVKVVYEVNGRGYAVNIWDGPGGHYVGRRLAYGTNISVNAMMIHNGMVFYRIGNHQWLDARYLMFHGVKSMSDSDRTTQRVFWENRVVSYQVNHIGYQVLLWQLVDGKMVSANHYLHDGTAVKILESKTINGISYARIEKNSWIQMKYLVSPDSHQTGGWRAIGIAEIAYTVNGKKYSINVWRNPATKDFTGKRLMSGQLFKVFAIQFREGKIWYNVGLNQWIDASYALYKQNA